MSIETKSYRRKQFHVDAVQVTEENIRQVAKWCKGEVQNVTKMRTDGEGSRTRTKVPYIHVEVHRPLNERHTKAFVGDWILKSDAGFKVYTEKAFENSFEEDGVTIVNTPQEPDTQVRLMTDPESLKSVDAPVFFSE